MATPQRYRFVTRYSWDGALIQYMTSRWLPHVHGTLVPAKRLHDGRYYTCDLADYYDVVASCDVPINGNVTLMFTHIQSVYSEYRDIESTTMHYSAVESTASLVFKWLQTVYPDATPPRCLAYIDDMTIWKWVHPRSRDFYESVKTKVPSLEYIKELEGMTDAEFTRLLDKGEAIRESTKAIMGQLSCNNVHRDIRIDRKSYKIIIVESATFANEIAESLLDEGRVHAVAVVRYDMSIDCDNRWAVSVRALPDGPIDAGHLARLYGGGGSANTAGFTYTGPLSRLFTDEDGCVKNYALRPKKSHLGYSHDD